ncbi:12824_t:CDS:2 [Entrophospora sp. SA101]|nr:12824_t:CDS:2 [Entrophospora sp. SA101]
MELLNLVPRLKKSKPQLFEPESDMEEEWIIEHEKQLMEGECLAAVKKFERDNEKLTGEGKSPKPDENLKQLLKNIDEKEKLLKNERKSGKIYDINLDIDSSSKIINHKNSNQKSKVNDLNKEI